jgi:hypothetical protein
VITARMVEGRFDTKHQLGHDHHLAREIVRSGRTSVLYQVPVWGRG